MIHASFSCLVGLFLTICKPAFVAQEKQVAGGRLLQLATLSEHHVVCRSTDDRHDSSDSFVHLHRAVLCLHNHLSWCSIRRNHRIVALALGIVTCRHFRNHTIPLRCSTAICFIAAIRSQLNPYQHNVVLAKYSEPNLFSLSIPLANLYASPLFLYGVALGQQSCAAATWMANHPSDASKMRTWTSSIAETAHGRYHQC